MVMCARNRARVCGFAEAAACGEVALVSPVLPLAALRAYMTFPYSFQYSYNHTARGRDGPHMHARPRHAPTDTPARFRTAKLLSTSPRTRGSRQRCASTEASIHRSILASRPFPTVLLLLSRFLPSVSIPSDASVFLLSPQGSRNKENLHPQSLPGTRCCWRPKWAPRSPHPGKQSNKDTLTRVHQIHAHTHAAPCSRSLFLEREKAKISLRERENEREKEKERTRERKREHMRNDLDNERCRETH